MPIDDGPLIERDQIRTLLAIAEANSFSAAAAALGVRQPAVSQQIRRLEARIGRPVFRRSSRGVALTPEGEAIMIYVRAMVSLTEDLRRHLRGGARTEIIRIALTEDFSRTALPTVLWLFAQEHPEVELRISCVGFDRSVSDFREGRVDACVLVADPRIPEAEPLWSAKLVWFGRRGLSLPVADPVPLIVPPADAGVSGPGFLRNVAIETLAAAGRSWRIAVETFSLATAESALQAGLGVLPLPQALKLAPGVAELAAGHGLPEPADRRFVIMTRDDAPGSVTAFCALIRAAAAMSFEVDART
ncbi:LysR family transcriptional regulator [Chenggangzhangella methanolivorans]|uniref:LysR family transcriptional regulator n=1 Tax=Chenggangzhangella methanolivorans TaxID=1437009 RepID=A0A9E6R6X5_9HYPH|nr:LysR family transcriptional regulator [Chenggangzhangella methanolivorans]QZN98526.1 LysR family transcriptional regulator [Chenggangzhangella methanolivorans]